MEIIKDNIEEILVEADYVHKEKFPDKQLNLLYNYWYFLNEQEEYLGALKNISLEICLYSKLYWFSCLADRFYEVYGFDAGIDQQQSKIIEEIDQRIDNVDWNLVEMLQHGKQQNQ